MIKHAAEVATSNYHYTTTEYLCGCHNTLYTHINHNYYDDNHEAADVNTVLSVPANREKVRQIKKTGTMMKKAGAAFSKVLAEQKRIFKETTAQYIDAFRVLRTNTLNAIKQTTEYREYSRLHKSYHSGVNTFKKKHKIEIARQVFGEPSSWRNRYGRVPSRLLRRAFRFRV
jgi:hypothetical protein